MGCEHDYKMNYMLSENFYQTDDEDDDDEKRRCDVITKMLIGENS